MNPTRITRSTIALATAGLVFGAVMFGTGVSAASAAPQGPGRSGDAHAEHGHPNPDAVRGHDEEGKHGKGHESHGNGHGYGHGDHDDLGVVVVIDEPANEAPATERPTAEAPAVDGPDQLPIVDQVTVEVSVVDANPVAQVLWVGEDGNEPIAERNDPADTIIVLEPTSAPEQIGMLAVDAADTRSGGPAAGVILRHC